MPGKALLWSEEAITHTGIRNTEARTEPGFKCPPCLIYDSVSKWLENVIFLNCDLETDLEYIYYNLRVSIERIVFPLRFAHYRCKPQYKYLISRPYGRKRSENGPLFISAEQTVDLRADLPIYFLITSFLWRISDPRSVPLLWVA